MARKRTKEVKPDEVQLMETTANDLPSLDLIFPIAMESYETTRLRLQTHDERIHRVLLIILTVTGAVLIAYQLFGITPSGCWLIGAGAAFLLGVAACIVAMMMNKLLAVPVANLFSEYLHLPEWIAKVSLIKHAGTHLDKNLDYIDKRQNLLIAATICLALEIICLVASGL